MEPSFKPTKDKVEKFRDIPLKSHRSHITHVFPDSFTGSEAVSYIKSTFSLSSKESVQLGTLLMQANVFRPANYTMNSIFNDKSKCIYFLNVSKLKKTYFSSILPNIKRSFEFNKNIFSLQSGKIYFGCFHQRKKPS